MTDEQIDALADAHGYRVADVGIEFTGQQFRAAVREAVKQEREACAKLVSDVGDDWERIGDQQKVNACDYLEDAIRSRTAVPAKE